MRRSAGPVLTSVGVLLLCLVTGVQARASVFRDRAQFEAAAQNLHTIDFDTIAPTMNPRDGRVSVDGVYFQNLGGSPQVVQMQSGNKVLLGPTVGEVTWMTILLPPGTTAVGCDQFTTPMEISTSTGEFVAMSQTDGSTFVGFTSDKAIEVLTVKLDFPEPTPNALLDNLTYGQRRAGNEPPVPQLLTTTDTGRAVALDSVTTVAEPFDVISPRNAIASDRRTRVTLFLVGVRFSDPSTDVALVTARAEDSQHRVFDLVVEGARNVKNLRWMAQVTVRLPDELNGAGDVSISVSVRGAESNKATVHIDPSAN